MISKQRLPTTKPNKKVSTAVSFFESPREFIFLVHISLCFLVDHDTSFPCRRSCKDVSTNTDPNAKIRRIEQYAQNLEHVLY